MSPFIRSAAAVAEPANDATPSGEPLGGRVTVPRNAGPGWLRSMMQEVAGSVAAGLASGPVQPVAISKIAVLQDVVGGDMLRCDVEDVRYGATSVTLTIVVWLDIGPEFTKVTAATYTFIAVDGDGRPRPVHEAVTGVGSGD